VGDAGGGWEFAVVSGLVRDISHMIHIFRDDMLVMKGRALRSIAFDFSTDDSANCGFLILGMILTPIHRAGF
jgi:hypothetical protein